MKRALRLHAHAGLRLAFIVRGLANTSTGVQQFGRDQNDAIVSRRSHEPEKPNHLKHLHFQILNSRYFIVSRKFCTISSSEIKCSLPRSTSVDLA